MKKIVIAFIVCILSASAHANEDWFCGVYLKNGMETKGCHSPKSLIDDQTLAEAYALIPYLDKDSTLHMTEDEKIVFEKGVVLYKTLLEERREEAIYDMIKLAKDDRSFYGQICLSPFGIKPVKISGLPSCFYKKDSHE
ncbi:MAG: hypothetical protein B6245_21300 [Desulfobacteraceae bacterium 4572_88]|nr:MAG: hypothetical protein B6245_21300 [Desulfobacteraceae bacterium 4572_88]